MPVDLEKLARDAAALIGEDGDAFARGARRLNAGAELVQRGREAYQRMHWGMRGTSPDRVSSVPDASAGVVELGCLAEIAYLTKKGNDRRVYAYTHRFGRGARDPQHLETGACPRCGHMLDPGRFGDPATLPVLGVTVRDSGLVIVRGDSHYRVGERGIVG